MRLLVTRPEEDVSELAAKLQAAGHDVLISPLLSIEIDPTVPLTREPVQALLVTSANGLRALAARPDLAAWLSVPLCAVGMTTGTLAQELGFRDVYVAGGDVEALTELVCRELDPGAGPLIHVAGTVVAGAMKDVLTERGYQVQRVTLYNARAADRFRPEAADALQAGEVDGVLLYSRRTAQIFTDLVCQAGLSDRLASVTAYCLSANAAAPLEALCIQEVKIAAQPNEAQLLSLLPLQ